MRPDGTKARRNGDFMDRFDEIIAKYRMVYDHHTHTTYSHGKGSIADNVRVAAAKGLKSIAITDHGPGHMTYGLDRAKIPQMRAEIAALKKEFPDMEILLGVEANTMRIEPYIDVPASERGDYNILLAGYHYGIRHAGMIANYAYKHAGFFRGEDSSLKVANTAMILDCLYFNEEAGNHIDVLTHPGDKGPFDIEDIAKACADTGTLIEINDKHAHLTVKEIKIAAKFDVSFIIGSDAHVPEKVGSFEGPLRRALEAGLDPGRIVNISLANEGQKEI